MIHMQDISRTALAALVLAAAAALPQAASAQQAAEPASLGTFQDWEALTYKQDGASVCYVVSSPKKSDAAKKVKRGKIYFMVTHAPARKVRGQPSTMIGYTFKQGSAVTLSVDKKSFEFYPVDNMAWTDKPETEKAILAAMRNGKSMTVKGVSSSGTETTDSYSLAGISAALDKIDSACK